MNNTFIFKDAKIQKNKQTNPKYRDFRKFWNIILIPL